METYQKKWIIIIRIGLLWSWWKKYKETYQKKRFRILRMETYIKKWIRILRMKTYKTVFFFPRLTPRGQINKVQNISKTIWCENRTRKNIFYRRKLRLCKCYTTKQWKRRRNNKTSSLRCWNRKRTNGKCAINFEWKGRKNIYKCFFTWLSYNF